VTVKDNVDVGGTSSTTITGTATIINPEPENNVVKFNDVLPANFTPIENTLINATVVDEGTSVTGSATFIWQVLHGSTWVTEGYGSSFRPSAYDAGDQMQVIISFPDPGQSGAIEQITQAVGTVPVQESTTEQWAAKSGGGNWKTGSTWNTGIAPTPSTDVVVGDSSGPSGPSVTIDSGAPDVAGSLSIEMANASVGGGTAQTELDVTNAVSILAGSLDIKGTLKAGSIWVGSAGTLTLSGGIIETNSITGVISEPTGSGIIEGISGAGSSAAILSYAKIVNVGTGVTGSLAIDSNATLELSGRECGKCQLCK